MKNSVLLKRGAEPCLYLTQWQDMEVVAKKRLPKKYRPPELDRQIRTFRTIHEAQLMHEAKKAGVPTPLIYLVDVKNTTIIMEYAKGKQLKKVLAESQQSERRNLCANIGKLIGKLHKHGVIHGDLTTSNMILDGEGKVFFVDFGLGGKTTETEETAVDMHLMKRALQSTHFKLARECFEHVVSGYVSVLGSKTAKSVLDKVGAIEKRGRYVVRGNDS